MKLVLLPLFLLSNALTINSSPCIMLIKSLQNPEYEKIIILDKNVYGHR